MTLSMTGVGKSIVRLDSKTITIFIKTLNSKQLDISTRIAPLYRERELEVRSRIADRLLRGKVELSISIDDNASQLADVQEINHEALRYYVEEFNRFVLSTAVKFPTFESLLRLPGVLMSRDGSTAELSDEEWKSVMQGVEECLDAVVAFRQQEGTMLQSVVSERIINIKSLLEEVNQPEGERIEVIRAKIEEGLQKIKPDGYDKGRLEQELIYYIERLDINEEKDRLRHHLAYFMEVLEQSQGGQGKTLGFIAQEIGREINTLGSKSNNAQMQQIVVRMKDELEQIKEQSLNIL